MRNGGARLLKALLTNGVITMPDYASGRLGVAFEPLSDSPIPGNGRWSEFPKLTAPLQYVLDNVRVGLQKPIGRARDPCCKRARHLLLLEQERYGDKKVL